METRGNGARGGMARPVQEETLREGRISRALVDTVANKVYAMLLLELETERERKRWPARRPFSGQGGG